MRGVQRLVLGGLILLGSVGCDQITKQVAIAELRHEPAQSFLGDTFRLAYAENPGAFLGLGGRLPASAQFWILTVAVGALLLGMAVHLFMSKKLDKLQTIALSLIVGGGVSNWIDRLLNEGRVVDFLNMGIGSLRTGIFNVADVAIMAGAAVLIVSSFRRTENQVPVGEA